MGKWEDNPIVNELGRICTTYIPDKQFCYDETKNNICFFTHTLKSGGAPIVLLELIKCFEEKNNIFLISKDEGNLLEVALEKNIVVSICPPAEIGKLDKSIWSDFKCVWLNTLLCYDYLWLFQNTSIEVYWWIHEPEILFESMKMILPHFCLISQNVKILSVSKLVQKNIEKYYNISTEVLHMPICDEWEMEQQNFCHHDIVTFFLPAKVQYIKGQDVLMIAISILPKEYLYKARFVFAGAKDEMEPEYYDTINKWASFYPGTVMMLGEISKKDVYQIYKEVDCVVAPSRVDATPTTIVEGMMFEKLCICSDRTGISMYIENQKNGFIFKSEDEKELSKLIQFIIDHYDDLDEIKKSGRKLFLEEFETNVVWNKLKNICKSME